MEELPGLEEEDRKGEPKGEETEQEKIEPKDWWWTNPNPVTEWKIPDGKTFTNVFAFNKELLKANTMGWPRIKSHDPRNKGRKKHFCLKCQCIGSCSSKCGMTHVIPKKLDETTKKTLDDWLKGNFG
jgi:hypothetical protein